MPKHCSIYVFHSGFELNKFSFFDIKTNRSYFKEVSSGFIKTPLYLSLQKDQKLRVSCYFSGTYLTSLDKHELEEIRNLVKKGQIELLLGTYHYSLSCLFSPDFFKKEISDHQDLLQLEFGVRPQGFLNTIAIFSNDLVLTLQKEKIAYCITPRVEWYLGSDTSYRAVKSKDQKLNLLLVGGSKSDTDLLVSYVPGDASKHWDLETITAKEAVVTFQKEKIYNLPDPVGLDREGRDLTHFFGNALQKQALSYIGTLASAVLKSKNEKMMKDFLALASPAVFDLMSRHYSIRYDHYTSLMNCLADLKLKT
ncbi:MAG: hypothetical protein GDA51_10130 [Ekhidna sp.]|nr:hypothetical protein [Ekhidna sp.]MBC6426803.1 hypothetical protein [Ekhidna sp.]